MLTIEQIQAHADYVRWFNAVTPNKRKSWRVIEPYDQRAWMAAYPRWYAARADKIAAGELSVRVGDRPFIVPPEPAADQPAA
ncbi:hypothetical protein NF699_09530 [Sphingomonadaceae bacterium OTU29LAMAA1]|nr:hypothetical protein NF699_09530 [Sphingomonadaceae bacterium OTU29LAMAA1]